MHHSRYHHGQSENCCVFIPSEVRALDSGDSQHSQEYHAYRHLGSFSISAYDSAYDDISSKYLSHSQQTEILQAEEGGIKIYQIHRLNLNQNPSVNSWNIGLCDVWAQQSWDDICVFIPKEPNSEDIGGKRLRYMICVQDEKSFCTRYMWKSELPSETSGFKLNSRRIVIRHSRGFSILNSHNGHHVRELMLPDQSLDDSLDTLSSRIDEEDFVLSDTHLIASLHESGQIYVWNLQSPVPLYEVPVPADACTRPLFTSTSTCGSSPKLIARFISISMDSSGEFLTAATESKFIIWNLSRKECLGIWTNSVLCCQGLYNPQQRDESIGIISLPSESALRASSNVDGLWIWWDQMSYAKCSNELSANTNVACITDHTALRALFWEGHRD